MITKQTIAVHHEGRTGNPGSPKRILRVAILPAIALGLMGSFAVNANATPYDYTIAPTTFDFAGSTTETISGSFSFSGSDAVSVDLTMTGNGPGLSGTYSVLDQFYASNDILFASDAETETGTIAIVFASPLTGEVDPITLFEIGTGCTLDVGCGFVENAISIPDGAEAVPVTATPEPSSIFLLGSAVALLGLGWLSKPARRFLPLRVS